MDFWVLSRFDDVFEGYGDWKTYTSTNGISLSEVGDALSMIQMDPPQQVALRNLVSRAFTLRRIAEMEPRIRHLTGELLEALHDVRECDIIERFAALLPSNVICTMLGIPVDDHEQLRLLTEQILHRDPGTLTPPATSVDAATRVIEYFGSHVATKRKQPENDLVSALCAAELEGRLLDDAEILGFCFLLLSGGNETTEKLIANTLYLLARHPDQRRQVIEDPSLLPGAIEESLRLISPTQYMVRTTTRDVEKHGCILEKGKKVVLLIGAANRDDRKYSEPDRFDIRREMDRHLAFGYGTHFCLGASLARLESRVALEEIHLRLPAYDIDESGIEMVHAGNVAGMARLPIRFTPTPSSRI